MCKSEVLGLPPVAVVGEIGKAPKGFPEEAIKGLLCKSEVLAVVFLQYRINHPSVETTLA